MREVASKNRIRRCGAVLAIAVAIIALLPDAAAAHGSCSLSVDTFQGPGGYVKGQVRISCGSLHDMVCAQASLQYKQGGSWHNLVGGQFNCNDSAPNVKTAQATATGPICGADPNIFAWRAYGFGTAQPGNHRKPASGYSFDSSVLFVDFCT